MSISGLSPVGQYLIALKDEKKAAADYAQANPMENYAIKKFEKDAAGITSSTALLNNYTALQVALGAYGLGSIINETALVKDLLTQDPNSPKSLARSSGNATWLAFADAFVNLGQASANTTSSSDKNSSSDKTSSTSATNTTDSTKQANQSNQKATNLALIDTTKTNDQNKTTDTTNSTSQTAGKTADSWKTTDKNKDKDKTADSNQNGFTPEKIASIIQAYELNQYETNTENTNSGIGNALYFTRAIAGKKTVDEIMSDARLLNVVVTVCGFNPDQFGVLGFDQQQRLIKQNFKFSSISTPQKIQEYAERYLAMLQINPQPPDTPETMMDLFGNGSNSNSVLALFGDNGSTSEASLYASLF